MRSFLSYAIVHFSWWLHTFLLLQTLSKHSPNTPTPKPLPLLHLKPLLETNAFFHFIFDRCLERVVFLYFQTEIRFQVIQRGGQRRRPGAPSPSKIFPRKLDATITAMYVGREGVVREA